MRRAVRLYVLVTQFIFTTIILSICGYILGNHLEPNGTLGITLAGAGLGIAFFVNIIMIYQFMKKRGDDDES